MFQCVHKKQMQKKIRKKQSSKAKPIGESSAKYFCLRSFWISSSIRWRINELFCLLKF